MISSNNLKSGKTTFQAPQRSRAVTGRGSRGHDLDLIVKSCGYIIVQFLDFVTEYRDFQILNPEVLGYRALRPPPITAAGGTAQAEFMFPLFNAGILCTARWRGRTENMADFLQNGERDSVFCVKLSLFSTKRPPVRHAFGKWVENL